MRAPDMPSGWHCRNRAAIRLTRFVVIGDAKLAQDSKPLRSERLSFNSITSKASGAIPDAGAKLLAAGADRYP